MNGIENILDQEVRETTDDLVNKILEERFDHTKPIPDEPYYPIRVDHKGVALEGAALLGVYGMPKSRKSSFVSMIAAAAISKEKRYENIEVDSPGAVVWIDTEQSEREVDMFAHRLIKMAGLDPQKDDVYLAENLVVLKLRKYDQSDRLRAVDAMFMSNVLNNVGMVVLDGIADFTYNANDMDTSLKLVTRIMQWMDHLEVFGICTLHTNKDGKDATGALGGFLNKKATYTIKCVNEYDTGPTQIRPYYNRTGQAFEPFLIDNVDSVLRVYHPEADQISVKNFVRRGGDTDDEVFNDKTEQIPTEVARDVRLVGEVVNAEDMF